MESGSPLKVRVFYFDFDSAKVGADYATTLAAHAKFLSASKLKMRIEGHADERGSTEYNMSLGQKRSDAIRRALAALGAADGGIETISWGEAKPAVVGHDEAAWSKNRRVEIRYSDEN
jgi:peptidoglycan-associated lipoprotein